MALWNSTRPDRVIQERSRYRRGPCRRITDGEPSGSFLRIFRCEPEGPAVVFRMRRCFSAPPFISSSSLACQRRVRFFASRTSMLCVLAVILPRRSDGCTASQSPPPHPDLRRGQSAQLQRFHQVFYGSFDIPRPVRAPQCEDNTPWCFRA